MVEKKGTLTKFLAVVGTVLTWFPIFAMIVTAVPVTVRMRAFRMDYLMPAELFPVALIGGGLLIWAALRAHSRQKLIVWGLVIAVGVLFSGQLLAIVTGLASGAMEPTGWWWALLVASLVIYTLAVAEVGVGGILLIRDLSTSKG